MGKTALARAVAAAIAADFPDARLEADLYGFTPGTIPPTPKDMLADLLSWAGFEAAQIPDGLDGRQRLWRGWLAERRVLLLLDNARNTAHIQPLLPHAAPGCLALITSRDELVDLDEVQRLRLDTLTRTDAVKLLRARSDRPLPTSSVLEQIARLCGYLPLTLDPIGRRLARVAPEHVRDALHEAMAQGRERFHHLFDIDQRVRAAFTVSYQALNPAQQQIVRWCARHPGPDFDAHSIGALSGQPMYVSALRLDELHGQALLSLLPTDRYTFHDLFAEYADNAAAHGTHLDAAPEQEFDAYNRLATLLQQRVKAAIATLTSVSDTPGAPTLFATPAEARAWLSAATGELITVAEMALQTSVDDANNLVIEVARWLRLDDRAISARDLYTRLGERARSMEDRLGEAHAVWGLGDVARLRDEYMQAAQFYQQAHTLFAESGNTRGQADAVRGLGEVARLQDEFAQAAHFFEQAHILYAEIRDRRGQADALRGLGDAARLRDECEEAAQFYQQARTLYADIGDRRGQADALRGLGDAALMQDEYMQTAEFYQQARTLYAEIGNIRGQADATRGLGDAARIRGEYGKAAEFFEQARILYAEIRDRRGQGTAVMGLGEVARLQDDYLRASQFYQLARTLYEEIESRRGQATAVLGLGDAERMRGEYVRASHFYQLARTLYVEVGNQRGQANVFVGLAKLAEAQKQSTLACEMYAVAQEGYQSIGFQHGVQYCQDARDRLACW
ncbi:hypothetical protein GCM10023334_126160 [Nonomuraea thailandensis]